ncbi:VirK/YbjX family protein [Mesorhizobium sp. AR10]|uniref:VirK/YbjX family protein n=1 Tax=Mesorhizobium sp. AR10 TaxID=2865839 RepID=UPI00216089F2|nr:VirK/YbjX family protein [Mesorhizobium sp. AR10]UVK39471.1 VirK/YbjX family protein [Mesorhizobium sp. AR10]
MLITRIGMSKAFFEGPALIRYLRLAKLYLKCLSNWPRLRDWHEKHSGTKSSEILRRHPLLPALSDRPYINVSWSQQKSQHVIETHYRLIQDFTELMGFPSGSGVALAYLRTEVAGLEIVLDKPNWFQDEGEVVLNLFLEQKRICSLAFTLGRERTHTVAYIGALQGGEHGEEALERNRLITRGAFGMRPRDLTIAAFRLLCAHLKVDKILAPMDRDCVARSSYFAGRIDRIHFRHDATWIEHGASVSPSHSMFDLPVAVPFRTPSEMPPRKRAMYRRRYEMLQLLNADIGRSVQVNSANTT